jgi:glyoxylase-like metal-dependent hydrolase (beta-lactamase superfamily II)
MKLTSLPTGFFKLDGGAMFGVVPKSLWQRTNPADENNLCTWSMRLLLVEDGDRLTLIDTGIGQKQDEKFFSHYHLHGEDTLDRSLAAAGYHRSDITDVFLTHLHFDHVGGAVERRPDGMLVPAFPKATFWSNKRHWQWATEPNAREKASFLKENILPLQESGQLRFLDTPEGVRTVDTPLGFQAVVVNGHTEAQMLPLIPYQGSQLLYMGDLLPSVGHIPLPYVMGYDTRPLITLEEKTEILHRAAQENWTLFLEHDSVNTWCRLAETEKGPRLAEAGDAL